MKTSLKVKDMEVKHLREEVKQLTKATEIDGNSKARLNDLRITHNSTKDELARQKMNNSELRRKIPSLKNEDTMAVVKLRASHKSQLDEKVFELRVSKSDLEKEKKANKELEGGECRSEKDGKQAQM